MLLWRERERANHVEEVHLLHELPRVPRRAPLQPLEQLRAAALADVRVHEHPGHGLAAVRHGAADLRRVVRPVHHQRTPSPHQLEPVDRERAVRAHDVAELLQARRVHRDVEAVPLLPLDHALLDEIVPRVLEVRAEEEAGAALVGRVAGAPAEAGEEHGAAALHLARPRTQEAGEVGLELALVRGGDGLRGAVDEHPPAIVRRRRAVTDLLRHLREPVQREGGGEHVDGLAGEEAPVERPGDAGRVVRPRRRRRAFARGEALLEAAGHRREERREQLEQRVEVVAGEVGEEDLELGGVAAAGLVRLGDAADDDVDDEEAVAAAGATQVGRREELVAGRTFHHRVQCLLQKVKHAPGVQSLFIASLQLKTDAINS
jgi:hypothetical protein